MQFSTMEPSFIYLVHGIEKKLLFKYEEFIIIVLIIIYYFNNKLFNYN